MMIALGVLGGVLLLIALVDVLVTIFNYDGFSFITSRLHHLSWRAMRLASRPLPVQLRHDVLSLGAAAMLPLTLAWWLALEITAFALMYLPGMSAGLFSLSDHVQPHIGSAYYLSAGAISSLTFGDVLARTGVYQALVDVETIIGLATFTLALTYVLAALDALGSLNRLYGRVRRHAVEPNRPATILARYFHGGQPEELSNLLAALAEDLETYDQGLRRFPVVFYFHTRRVERSTPQVFAVLGDLIELLRFGLPSEEPLTSHPSLLALAEEYTTTVRRLQRSFVGPSELQLPDPVSEQDFVRLTGRQPEASSPVETADGGVGGEAVHVEAFRRLREAAGDASGRCDEDPQTEYDSYRDWLAFHHQRSVFLEHLRHALGYGD